jgi:hypothetical protein
MSSLNPS